MKTVIKKPIETDSKSIVLTFFENKKELSAVQSKINEKFSNVVCDNILKNFEAKFGETLTFPLQNGVKITALGLGKYEDLNKDKLREAVSKTASSAGKYTENGVLSIELPAIEACKKCTALAEIVSIGMNAYKFDKYKSKKSEHKIETLEILTEETDSSIEEAAKIADTMVSSMSYTKDLVFESAEIMTPAKVSEIAEELAREYGLEYKVFSKEELKQMGMNAFLAVGQGSAQEPKMIHLTYKSQNPKKKIALIGKGITFDSGGLDIKPASSMLTMKTDMTGCATVLGVMKAIAELKPEIELHVISALCENMPSGSSYKVGDILISKSKKTIEVDNTDAEGRLTLADALTYADELEPDEVIDIATLTGAVITALGNNITGIMGNNQEQIDEFKHSACKMGERVWQLPIYDDMMDNLKSDIADMKNTGNRYAGSSVAGRFLQNFTKSNKWLHIDIAGTAYTDKSHKEVPKGATGVMVRSLIKYLIG